jgi:hypothetical protein
MNTPMLYAFSWATCDFAITHLEACILKLDDAIHTPRGLVTAQQEALTESDEDYPVHIASTNRALNTARGISDRASRDLVNAKRYAEVFKRMGSSPWETPIGNREESLMRIVCETGDWVENARRELEELGFGEG